MLTPDSTKTCNCRTRFGSMQRNGSGHASSCPCYRPLDAAQKPASEEFDPFWPVKQVIRERDEALDRVASLERQLAERIDMCGELSEARVKVQVKWGAEADRVDIMLDKVTDLLQGLPDRNILRQELQALVDRIEADIKRNPRQ